ncbi:MAG: sigma-70 family RNA polymerase sigma factor [Verrucomicrobiia bacterium]|jgi:RNA polymerase sigma-70 factor (ECF subfamily)
MASLATKKSTRHEEFISLYVRHEAAVFSFVLTIVRHSADAEDVVQRASMTMWRCFDKFEPGTNFRAWAFQIAKNVALNHLTKVKRDRHIFSEKLLVMLADRAEERSEDLDTRRRALDFCVEKLPPEARGIVEGCYASGSTIRSFAEETGETANKIYKRLNRVRAGLQKCVERQLGLEEAAP